MKVARVVILLSMAAGYLCDSYKSPSSYQNQVQGSFEDNPYLNSFSSFKPSGKKFGGNQPFGDGFPFKTSRGVYSGFTKSPGFGGFVPKAPARLTNATNLRRKNSSVNNYGQLKVSIPDNDRHGDGPIFSYDETDPYGPENWGKINQNCDGTHQSPISLYTQSASDMSDSRPLIIEGFYSIPKSVKVKNNGHSASFTLNYFDDKKARLLGGPLKGQAYIIDNVHFHWGEDKGGSEHTLDAKRYAAEVHVVSYNAKYESLAEAASQPKGLAVLGVFYELSGGHQSPNPFVKFLSKVIEPDTEYEEFNDVFSLKDLLKERDFNYLNYKGSLTTPGCLETVTWMVSTKPLQITWSELEEFRQLRDEKGNFLTKNFRPLQHANTRPVFLF